MGVFPLGKDVSSIEGPTVGEVWVFVPSLLLEVRLVGVEVDCFIEIMDFLIGENLGRVCQQLMVVFEANLCLAIVEFI